MALFARIALAALLVAGMFFLPRADPHRLAARQAHELFEQKEKGEDALYGKRADGTPRTFGELVLDGPHAYERTGDTLKFALAGARMEGVDIADLAHLNLRRSIVQGLRTAAAGLDAAEGGHGYSLIVPGQDTPVTRGASFLARIADDALHLTYTPLEGESVSVSKAWRPPDRFSLAPPLVAIALAIVFRRPLLALFCGILAGAFVVELRRGASVAASAGVGLLEVFRTYLWDQLVKTDRIMIIAFVVFMLAMVGVITKNGGIRGFMDRIARLASNARNSQVAAYLMGLAVFFDDYANCILVGSTMRPLTDKFRVSREKLAYIVDSTAAPVAGISIFSTWIAFEVSTFSAQLPAAGLLASDGYAVFLQTLPYRFYCIFSLVLLALLVFSGRDFGPMLAAERRARRGELVRAGGRPMVSARATEMEAATGVVPRARNALLPVLLFVGVTLFEIARGGDAFAKGSALFSIEGVTQVLQDGSGSLPLMIGSAAGLGLAVLLSVQAGLRGEIARAAWTTLRSMGIAIAILYLAWMIGAVCQDELGTGPYLAELISEELQPVAVLPMALFVLSGVIAFATGSSWSTMSILLPLVVSIAFSMGESVPYLGGMGMLILSIGAVLEGAIFGDHCSPISDTTVMSSIASASDHIDHVHTQAPYAVLSMVVAMTAGYFPCAFIEGYRPWHAWIVGVTLLVLVLVLRGRRADAASGIEAEGAASG